MGYVRSTCRETSPFTYIPKRNKSEALKSALNLNRIMAFKGKFPKRHSAVNIKGKWYVQVDERCEGAIINKHFNPKYYRKPTNLQREWF